MTSWDTIENQYYLNEHNKSKHTTKIDQHFQKFHY